MCLRIAKMFSTRISVLFVAIIYVAKSEAVDQYKTVSTNDGDVRGIQNTTILAGISFYSFRGIPYAQPPIDDLRFKAPVPVASWKPAVKDALNYSSICPFLAPNFGARESSEDCLTLNIFVPDVKPDEKLAVMFLLHGGGFHSGSGDDFFYGPDFIVEKQTILVTINSRLAALGFLSLDLPEYSGNMGLKDQQLALKWIHSNIEHFGGDNKRITIIGQGSGSALAEFHMLSEESRKYSRRAIAISGSVGNYWAISPLTDHKSHGFEIAKELNSSQDTTDGLIEMLKKTEPDVVNMFTIVNDSGNRVSINFSPIIEKKDAKQPFMVESPDELYKKLKNAGVNFMFTTTSAEMLPLTPKTSDEDLVNQTTPWTEPLPFRDVEILRKTKDKEYGTLMDEVYKFFFWNGAQYFEFLGDLNFYWGIHESVKKTAANSNGKTFFTRFSVDSELNAWTKLKLLVPEMYDFKGAGDGDDLCHLFLCGVARDIYDKIKGDPSDELSKISLKTIEYMTTLFTNFAKYGEPAYDNEPVKGFLPVKGDQINYLDITNDGLKIDSNPRQKEMDFWTKLHEKATALL